MNTANVSAAKVLASNKKFCQIILEIINRHPEERDMRGHAIGIVNKLIYVNEDELEYFQFAKLQEMLSFFPAASEDIRDGCDKILKIYRKEERH